MSMLTIKHVEKSGYESGQMAHNYEYIPAGRNAENAGEAEVICFGCTGRGGAVDPHGVCRYGDGIVYVMNDAGSTIARYDLD